MLRIVAWRAQYCDRFRNSRMNEISVTALSASVHETRAFKLGNKFSYLLWHEITLRYLVA